MHEWHDIIPIESTFLMDIFCDVMFSHYCKFWYFCHFSFSFTTSCATFPCLQKFLLPFLSLSFCLLLFIDVDTYMLFTSHEDWGGMRKESQTAKEKINISLTLRCHALLQPLTTWRKAEKSFRKASGNKLMEVESFAIKKQKKKNFSIWKYLRYNARDFVARIEW